MSNFKIYNIQEIDIINDSSLGNTSNTNQSTNCVFNLETIDGVNELQLENNEYVLIGYTAVRDSISIAQDANYFFNNNNTDNITFYDHPIINNNILKVPGNVIIKKITAKIIKYEPENPLDGNDPTNQTKFLIGLVNSSNPNSFIPIFGHLNGEQDPTIVDLLTFRNEQTVIINQNIDENYIFVYFINTSQDRILNTYQLEMKIYYTPV